MDKIERSKISYIYDIYLKELKECADVISETDNRMQNLYNNIVEY